MKSSSKRALQCFIKTQPYNTFSIVCWAPSTHWPAIIWSFFRWSPKWSLIYNKCGMSSLLTCLGFNIATILMFKFKLYVPFLEVYPMPKISLFLLQPGFLGRPWLQRWMMTCSMVSCVVMKHDHDSHVAWRRLQVHEQQSERQRKTPFQKANIFHQRAQAKCLEDPTFQ